MTIFEQIPRPGLGMTASREVAVRTSLGDSLLISFPASVLYRGWIPAGVYPAPGCGAGMTGEWCGTPYLAL